MAAMKELNGSVCTVNGKQQQTIGVGVLNPSAGIAATGAGWTMTKRMEVAKQCCWCTIPSILYSQLFSTLVWNMITCYAFCTQTTIHISSATYGSIVIVI